MKQSSEMLYKFICNYCKPTVLINFCCENYYNADNNSFLLEDIMPGIQLIKDEFYDKPMDPKKADDFSAFLETAKMNSINLFCKKLTDQFPDDKLRKNFKEKIPTVFNDFNKKACNPQSFYDIMNEYRLLEEQIKKENDEVI